MGHISVKPFSRMLRGDAWGSIPVRKRGAYTHGRAHFKLLQTTSACDFQRLSRLNFPWKPPSHSSFNSLGPISILQEGRASQPFFHSSPTLEDFTSCNPTASVTFPRARGISILQRSELNQELQQTILPQTLNNWSPNAPDTASQTLGTLSASELLATAPASGQGSRAPPISRFQLGRFAAHAPRRSWDSSVRRRETCSAFVAAGSPGTA